MVDIFNISVTDLEGEDKKSSFGENEFKPNPELSKDKVYRAVIRPLYQLDNIKKNFLQKTTWYFKEEDGNASGNHYFDSAYSIGEDCPAMKAFFDLNKRGKTDARAEELKKLIRPKTSYFYLVMVESDAVTPENVGKIMVYKAPTQVHKLIQNTINVSDEDKAMGVKPCNVFDPFVGKSIRMSINIVGGYWNYNGTIQLTDVTPVKFEGAELTEENKVKFVESLKESNKLLDPYRFKKMDDDRMKLLLSIMSSKTGEKIGNIVPLAKLDSSLEIAGIPVDEVKAETKAETKTTKAETKVAQEVKVEAPSSDDDAFLDDLLKDLDV